MKINELARAKLAHKNGLRVSLDCGSLGCIAEVVKPNFKADGLYKVHPDDNEKLDAVIWEGAESECRYAYASERGLLVHLCGKTNAPHLTLVATRNIPEEWDESRIDAIGQNGNEGLHYKTMSPEEAQLFSDIKEFAGALGRSQKSSLPAYLASDLEILLERINPKPVCRCCGQIVEEANQ